MVWVWLAQLHGQLGALTDAEAALARVAKPDSLSPDDRGSHDQTRAALARTRQSFGLPPGDAAGIPSDAEPAYSQTFTAAQTAAGRAEAAGRPRRRRGGPARVPARARPGPAGLRDQPAPEPRARGGPQLRRRPGRDGPVGAGALPEGPCPHGAGRSRRGRVAPAPGRGPGSRPGRLSRGPDPVAARSGTDEGSGRGGGGTRSQTHRQARDDVRAPPNARRPGPGAHSTPSPRRRPCPDRHLRPGTTAAAAVPGSPRRGTSSSARSRTADPRPARRPRRRRWARSPTDCPPACRAG